MKRAIAQRYPEINIDYLETGKGEMFKTIKASPEQAVTANETGVPYALHENVHPIMEHPEFKEAWEKFLKLSPEHKRDIGDLINILSSDEMKVIHAIRANVDQFKELVQLKQGWTGPRGAGATGNETSSGSPRRGNRTKKKRAG
jgi:uncharacterized UPF0160 family protein